MRSMLRCPIAILLLAASPSVSGAQSSLGAAWDAVGSILQAPGTLTGGYYRYNLPRRDITLHMGDVTVSPSLALGAWAGFSGTPAGAMIMGDLVLTNAGDRKIQVIKTVRELTDLGLREAKDIVDAAGHGPPRALIARGLTLDEANRWADAVARSGGWAELLPTSVGGLSTGVATPSAGPVGSAALVAGSRYDLYLLDTGSRKIQVIKEVRELTALGLKEAKDIADGASRQWPQLVARGLDASLVEQWARVFTNAGASVEARPAG